MAHKPPESTDAFIQSGIDRVRLVFAVDDPEWFPAYTFDLEADWNRLGCRTYDEMLVALRGAVQQISVDDWDEPTPPGLGVERSILGAPVFQFVYQCLHFDCLMFFRFAFKDGYLFVISFHPADFPKKKPKERLKK